MTGKKPFSLYTRKLKNGKPVYYVKFRLPDGSWSSGKCTGQISKNKAEAYCIDYLQTGGIIIKQNVTLKDFSVNFFDWNGSHATDKRVRGLRISPRHCLERTDLLNNHLIPVLGNVKLTAIDKALIKQFRNNRDNTGNQKTKKHNLSLMETLA